MRYNKYNNKKTYIDGIKFDSKAEADRYYILKDNEKYGLITNLKLQPAYEIHPKFKYDGKTVKAIKYIADFEYMIGSSIIVEDVKGVETAVFKLKRKMFLCKYGDTHELRVI